MLEHGCENLYLFSYKNISGIRHWCFSSFQRCSVGLSQSRGSAQDPWVLPLQPLTHRVFPELALNTGALSCLNRLEFLRPSEGKWRCCSMQRRSIQTCASNFLWRVQGRFFQTSAICCLLPAKQAPSLNSHQVSNCEIQSTQNTRPARFQKFHQEN